MEGIRMIHLVILIIFVIGYITILFFLSKPKKPIIEKLSVCKPKMKNKFFIGGCFDISDILEIYKLINYENPSKYAYYEDKISLERFNEINNDFKDDKIPLHNIEHDLLKNINKLI